MVSIYKLSIIVIILNLLIGVGTTMFQNSENEQSTTIQQGLEFEEEYMKTYTGEEQINLEGSGIQSTYGDDIGWGKTIWNIAFATVNPFSVHTDQFESNVEKSIVRTIQIFRTLLIIILAIKAYNWLKNKDTK